MAYSFGSSGALPKNPLSMGTLNLSPTAPSAAKALNTAANPFTKTLPAPVQGLSSAIGNASQNTLNTAPVTSSAQRMQGTFNTSAPTPGLLHQEPSTPVKSQTTNNVAGSSQTMTYHPTVDIVQKPTPQDNTSETLPTTNPNTSFNQTAGTSFGGVLNNLANTSSQGSSQGQTVTQNLADTSKQGSVQGQNITNNLANTSSASSPAITQYTQGTADAGMLNPAIAAKAGAIGDQYGGKISDLQKSLALQEAANASSGAPVGLGRAGLIAQYGGQLMQGYSAAEQAALAGTGQQLTAANQQAGALNEAAGQANTQQANIQSGLANAGGLANTAQSNVQSGLESAGSLANTAQQNKQSGINQAGTLAYPVTLSASSGQYLQSPTGEQVGGGLAGGATAYQSFQNMLSNSDIARSNAPVAALISQNMQQLSGASSQVMDLMNQVGPNIPGGGWYSTPIANTLASDYLTNKNPAAATSIKNGLNEMQGYVSSLLGSLPGQTPTAITDAVQNADFSKLSPSQLNDVMTNVQNYAATRLAPVQQTAQDAQNANLGGSTPTVPLYTGGAANSGAMQPGTANSTGTAVAGTVASTAASFFQSLLAGLHGAVQGAGAGVGAGAAESMFAPAAAAAVI